MSPWEKYGYESGQVVNGTVELLGPEMTGVQEMLSCRCLTCGEEYTAWYGNIRKGKSHKCSPWKKCGYESGQVVNGTVELLGPESTGVQERLSCRCLDCGEEYTAEYCNIRKGKSHKCSPWKRYGYESGQVVNGTVELLGPKSTSRREGLSCRCLACGEEYTSLYGHIRNGGTHRCSPWKRYGYESGQVVNGTVELLGQERTGRTERLSCRCLTCGEEYVAAYSQIRKGYSHQCVRHRCILGLQGESYRVVSKSWCSERSAPLFDIEPLDCSGEVVRGLTYAEVRTDYIPDEASVVCLEAWSAASNAIYRGVYSPWLDAIGTSVEDLRRRVPMSGKRSDKHVGHILPRVWASRFNSIPLGLLLNHHANLAWQDAAENLSLHASPWVDCPFIDAETTMLFAEIAAELRNCGAEEEAVLVESLACG